MYEHHFIAVAETIHMLLCNYSNSSTQHTRFQILNECM